MLKLIVQTTHACKLYFGNAVHGINNDTYSYRHPARATYSKMVGPDALAKNRLISQINVTTNVKELALPARTTNRSQAPIISFRYLPQMHRTYQLAARCTR